MNLFSWFMLLSTVATAVLLIYAVAYHTTHRSLFLIFSSFCTFLFIMGYLMEILSPNLEAAFMAVRIQKMGTPFLVVLNYLFMRDVYEKERLSFRKLGLIFVLPMFSLVTAQAFPLVRLHYTHIEYLWNGYIANCHGYAGPVIYLATVYNYIFAALSLRLIVRHLWVGSRQQRRRSRCLLASVLIPLGVNIYHTLSYNSLRLDWNPFAISVSAALLLYSVQSQDLLHVVPLARAQVIESMADAFIVCGKNYSFLDANQAAKALFPELNTLLPGETMEQVRRLRDHRELSLQIDGETRFYKITQTDILQSGLGFLSSTATCIVLHDITEKETQLQKLYGKATFDPLMHLYNRATFFDLAAVILGAEEAKGRSHGLLMIDLDHFKLVNDTYGHTCGDTVLETVAVLVKNHFRKSDLVGRYGGEEIVVLLENVPEEQLAAVMERLREKVERTTIPHLDHELSVTISIGGSYAPAGTSPTLEQLLVRADEALYNAKDSGRNRVRLHQM